MHLVSGKSQQANTDGHLQFVFLTSTPHIVQYVLFEVNCSTLLSSLQALDVRCRHFRYAGFVLEHSIEKPATKRIFAHRMALPRLRVLMRVRLSSGRLKVHKFECLEWNVSVDHNVQYRAPRTMHHVCYVILFCCRGPKFHSLQEYTVQYITVLPKTRPIYSIVFVYTLRK